MPDPLPGELQAMVPEPVLADRPAWVEIYWHTWAALAGHNLRARDVAAWLDAGPLSPSHARINRLRRQGRDEEARELAGRRLDELAREARAGPAEKGSGDAPSRVTLEPVVLLLQEIIGLRPAPDGRSVAWSLHEEPPVGARNLRIAANIINLVAQGDVGSGIEVIAEAEHSFDLEIRTGFTSFSERVPEGRTRYLLTHLDRTDIRRL